MKISRSQLFLTELIAAILLFALCMAVCAGVFLRAHHLARESQQQTQALYAAQTAAETFSADPNLSHAAKALEGQVSAEASAKLLVGYAKDWTPCALEQAQFLLTGTLTQTGSYAELTITVENSVGNALSTVTTGVYIANGGGEDVA